MVGPVPGMSEQRLPISAAFLTVCVLLLAGQLYVRWRSKGRIVAVDAIAVEES